MTENHQWFLVEIQVNGTIEAALLERQRAFLSQLTVQGDLVVAAVFPETKGRGIALLRAGSLDQAKSVYARAPVVQENKVKIDISLLRLTAGQLLAEK